MFAEVNLTESLIIHSSLQSIRIVVATSEWKKKKKELLLLFPLEFPSFTYEYFDSGSLIIWLTEFIRIIMGAQ